MKIQFNDYKTTPGEKHLGIASIILELEGEKILLRYKVQSGKDGKGHFYATASHKIDETTYVPSFVVNSNILSDSIKDCLKSGIKGHVHVSEDPDYVPF